MPDIEIKPSLTVGTTEILNGISHLKTEELEEFLQEVGHILAQKRVGSISERETDLILIINQSSLTPEEQKSYNRLYSHLQEETLTNEDHPLLLSLIKKQEKKAGERLAALVELAQIKKISLPELMAQMGLSTLSDG